MIVSFHPLSEASPRVLTTQNCVNSIKVTGDREMERWGGKGAGAMLYATAHIRYEQSSV